MGIMKMKNSVTVGELIKEYRQANRLSLQEFADRAGLSKSYINMLEKNHNSSTHKEIEPTVKTIHAVAKAMGMSPSELFSKATNISFNPTDEDREKLYGTAVPIEMALGENIRRARMKARISQEELAKRLGYKSRSTIAKIESGENDLTQKKVAAFAKALNVSINYLLDGDRKSGLKGGRIPVLGRVVAGIPLEAIEDIEDYEEIPRKIASSGEFFALKIKGRSMEPKLSEGDIVIVRKQEDVDSGDTAIVLVNGDEATVKQIKKTEAGIMLIGFNVEVYQPHFYSNEQIETLPVRIIGKVVESRHKW